MSKAEDPRMYVIGALDQIGSKCPKTYIDLLNKTPASKTIEGLDPWFFLPTPAKTAQYCSEAVGQPVLPFAQAVGQDLIACFSTIPSDDPGVLVVNPWSNERTPVVRAEIGNFAEWLIYAAKVSHEVQARESSGD